MGSEGFVKAGGEFVGDMFGDELSSGVESIEGWGFVEVVVGEGLADVDELILDSVKVTEESVVVELIADNGGGGFEVVAVDGFRMSKDGNRVGSAELVIDLNRKHGGV